MGYFFFILFLACLFVPIYCYLIFPLYLKLSVLSFPKVKNNYFEITEWPEVSVIFSVFNEEKVITKKIESILQSDYPKEKIKIFVGSDFSNDHSNDIIEEFVKQNRNINFIKKDSRSGKLNIINELVDLTSSEHLILTDANVFFEPQTLKALVYNLIAKNAQLVCGHILKFSPKNEGISQQEIFYMNFENQLKYNESLKYGFCVGVEGGCYAILKKNFIKVPNGFIMDDFFITLDVISKKGKVLFEPEALCYEDVNDNPVIEFKRKIRISLGNFRNLKYYKHLLFPIYKGFGFVFFSHKVCRWFTPFALIFSFLLSFLLSYYFSFFILISFIYSLVIILSMLAIFTEKIKVKIPVFNALGHFILMNLALLLGFIKFVSASNVSFWEPPKRNI
jgi:cellulose synthase/poly-beta-1,6-N-acetylglucosamine synthase-like glycosyltransferase